jgi:hypothetical protein
LDIAKFASLFSEKKIDLATQWIFAGISNSPLPEASAAMSEANDHAHTFRQHLSALEWPDFEVTTVYFNPRAQSRAESNDVLRRIRRKFNDDPGDDYTRRYPILLLRVRQSQDFHESRSS